MARGERATVARGRGRGGGRGRGRESAASPTAPTEEEETPEDGFNANACREFLTSSYQKGIERLNDAAQPHTQQYQSQAKVWGNAALLQPTTDDFGAKLSAALHAFRERPPS